MRPPEFSLVPTDRLSIHEEIDPVRVRALARVIRRNGLVEEPIWVDRASGVILNGHHRFAALRELGAVRIPAWLFDYDDPRIRLDRWGDGPAITKREVITRGLDRLPFPPKTSRHSVDHELASRPTPLSALLPAKRSASPTSRRARTSTGSGMGRAEARP